MFASHGFRTLAACAALAGLLVLAVAARAGAAALQVLPAKLDVTTLDATRVPQLHAFEPGYRGALRATTGNAAVVRISPASVQVSGSSIAAFTVVPVRAGTASVVVRDAAGHSVVATVRVTTVTLVIHDVPAVTRSLRIETTRYSDGATSATTANVVPRTSRLCAPEVGGTRCTLTVGVTPGAARLRVSFFPLNDEGGHPLAVTEQITTYTAATNFVRDLSNASFLNYFPVRYTPTGSVTLGPPGDTHLWFASESLNGHGIVRATTGGSATYYPTPRNSGYVSLASGRSALVWFAQFTNQPPGGYQTAYIGAITLAGSITLWPTPLDQTCATQYDPLSIAQGPDGNPWFIETLCRTIGIGTISGSSLVYYPMPLDVLGKAVYSDLPYQHEIVTGGDGALWFFVNRCGLNGSSVCSPAVPASGAIGHATTTGPMAFFPLPVTPACVGGFVARGGDGNVWFAQPCTPAGAPSYVGTTIGRIDRLGRITEYFGLATTANDIAEGPDGDIYLSWPGGIARVVTRGTRAGRIDSYLSMRSPSDLNSIGAGPDGKLYVTDGFGRYDRISVPSHPER